MKENNLKIGIKEVYEAYRKLKNFFYHDNTTLSIRYKIAEYEQRFYADGTISFEEQFSSAMENVLKIVNGEDKDLNLMESLLKEVAFKYITKAVEREEQDEDKDKENNRLIINRPIDTKIKVSKMNMLIDAPVEIHIISMLWVMLVGKQFKNVLKKNNYAYRFAYDEEEDNTIHGLQMFEPYYIGYQKWRDTALNNALWLLDQKRDASILCLDIQRYYYSVRLNIIDLLRNVKEKYELEIDLDNETIIRLSQLIQFINSRYTEVTKPYINESLRINEEDTKLGMTILPVGLLSSAILGNLYLCDFDESIVNKLNPVYYGRYVDDMIFVFGDHKIEQKEIISKFMACFKDKGILDVENDNGGSDDSYKLCQYSNLKIQKEKVALQHFFHNESRAAINKFRQNIDRQRSEFRFLPDEENVDEEFDNDAFSLQYSDSIQKLRSLKGFKEDKYGASKFLASKIFMASVLKKKSGTKESRTRTSQQILSFFKWRTCIDFCSLWEKVATYFFITDDSDSLKKFIKNAKESIKNIEGKDIPEEWVERYKDDLMDYLALSVATPFALYPEFKVEGFSEEIGRSCKNMALSLRRANLFRHNLLATPGINYTTALLDEKTNLYERTTPLGQEEQSILPYLAPCFFRYDEASLLSIFMWLESGEKVCDVSMQQQIYNDTRRLFHKINYSWYELFSKWEVLSDPSPNAYVIGEKMNWYFEVDNREGDVQKWIAIANMKVPDKQVEHSMLKKADLSSKRRDLLFSIINSAVKEKCNILVLPELSVPHQWLDFLVKQSKKHNIAIIAGVEYYHGKDDYVYNFVATILPFRMRYGYTAAINIRVKNYYSPHEKKLLEGYRYKIPSSKLYCLFHWRKVYFSVYNCFELANISDRSLFKSKVDFIVATELNKDVNYYADIAGSWVRDIHCYIVQVNTSHFGDSCIMQPSKTETCRMVSVKGGTNCTILVEELDIPKLRSFQFKEHITQMDDHTYKLTPPDFSRKNVEKRINNEPFLK